MLMKRLLYLFTLIFLIGCGGEKDSPKQTGEKKTTAPKKTAIQERIKLIDPIPSDPNYNYEKTSCDSLYAVVCVC